MGEEDDLNDDELFDENMRRMGLADRASSDADDRVLFEAAFRAPDDSIPDDALAPRDEPTRSAVTPRALHRQIRQGRLAADLELDLHGMRVDEARQAVDAFLRRAQHERHQIVRIICGRGLHSKGEAVLHDALPHWLRGEQHARVVIAIPAPGNRGGSGAWWAVVRPTN